MGSILRSPSIITDAEALLPGNGMTASTTAPRHASSALFTPLKIGNNLTLSHRVILAPLTRNRGIPSNPSPTPSSPNRTWIPSPLIKQYYLQRTTPGGLLITEGLPPNLEGNGMPGVPGLFLPEQIAGWKDIVSAVHEKGGFIYAQLWNAGRASLPQHTGFEKTISASATGYESDEKYSYPPPGGSEQVKYKDFPPRELSVEEIKGQIADYVKAAKAAIEKCGFDGVEIHGGNGYLPEQFLSSNINVREDHYGGTPEKRCNFLLEVMEEVAKVIGEQRLALRLTPFGLYNEARGEQRLETWGHLCRELKALLNLSYVHFLEPRYEQVHSLQEKEKFLESWGMKNIDLKIFRDIFGTTPFISAGGWSDKNAWGVVEYGKYDALAIGRYFISTPDLVERLKQGLPLTQYDRSRFYGPFPDPEVGYTDYPVWEQMEGSGKKLVGA